MIENMFEVNNEEKSRILNLHESATKRQYLSEQNKPTPKELAFNLFTIFRYKKDKYDIWAKEQINIDDIELELSKLLKKPSHEGFDVFPEDCKTLSKMIMKKELYDSVYNFVKQY
jgi:hypothetical protein